MPKIYIAAASALLLFTCCSVTRRVPAGQYLLMQNVVEEDRQTPRKERIRGESVSNFIKPATNRKILGMNVYLQLYNLANPDTTRRGWFNRSLRNMGEAPVLLDSTLARQSAEIIRNYSVYAGFYDSEVGFSVDTGRRKAVVTYSIKQNTPYRIGRITYQFRDEFLRPIIMQDSAATLLRSGDVLSGNVLATERARIVANLKNNGYYDFTLGNIEFVGDTLSTPHVADLEVIFKQYLSGYTPQGDPVYENSSIYRLDKIVLNPDYDAVEAATDPDYYKNMDTLNFRGLDILYNSGEKPNVRSRILRRAINLYPNYLYGEKDVQQAYSNIMRLGYYRNANILFNVSEGNGTPEENQVSYIGEGADSLSLETTTERYLSCQINCIPSLRHSYKVELEGSTSSNFYALNATLGYQNRNLLRGAELFDASIKGGYEFMRSRSSNKKSSFEIGGSMSLSFPRFVAPLNLDRYNRLGNPRTRIELSVSTQRRSVYHRTLSSISWGYSWNNQHNGSFTLRPIDVNLVKMGYVDPEFMGQLNSYLQNSYVSQLITGISGSYVYNSQMNSATMSDKARLLRFNWETAGNLASLLSHTFNQQATEHSGEKYYEIFGIRYAQYFRVDAGFSNRIMLGPNTSIAYRLYGGIGQSYGNANSIPFERLFYAGGSSSMRGWIARKLGPGNVYVEQTGYPSQVANMKLEANAELRFPVWSLLEGALFFDVGNIWFLGEDYSDDAGVFKLNRFYKQLGFNTGLGFRFDIGMAILRFDWGIRLHDPNREQGARWIDNFKLSNTVLNFGVGYPF